MKRNDLPPPSKELYEEVLVRLREKGRSFASVYRELKVVRGSAVNALAGTFSGPVARRLRRKILRRAGMYPMNGDAA